MTAPRPLPIATTFCSATLPLWDGLELFLDGNSKITRSNGTFEAPQPNALSLPAASVPSRYPHAGPRPCPGSTPTCRASCYVKGLAAHAPELYTRYEQNAEALAAILANPGGRQWNAAAHKLGRWIAENARGGFRWHVSGDVLSLAHAQWIAEVCHRARPVHFWIYTRTLVAVQTLAQVKNLAVNVSADVDNYAAARAVALEHGARICYLTERADHEWLPFHENAPRHCKHCGQFEDHVSPVATASCLPPDLPAGSVIFPDYALRGRGSLVPTSAPWWQSLTHEQRAMVCGTDLFGQSEAHRCGPCTKCF